MRENGPLGGTVVSVAEAVRAQLNERKLSARKLARCIGKTRSYVARRVSGETPFRDADLLAIADVLDLSVSQLLDETVPKPSGASQAPSPSP